MRILIVDFEGDSGLRLAERLGEHGFVAEVARSATEALRRRLPEGTTALVIDLGMGSRAAGTEVVRGLRGAGLDQPILILSAHGSWSERVDTLDAGADDYLVKPVRAEEVAARLRAILRRAAGCASETLCAGDFALDLRNRQVTLCGEPLDLTRNEFRLLRLLLLQPDRTLGNRQIQQMLSTSARTSSLNAVEVHVGRLRKKIGRERIRTIRGVGYRLEAESRESA